MKRDGSWGRGRGAAKGGPKGSFQSPKLILRPIAYLLKNDFPHLETWKSNFISPVINPPVTGTLPSVC